MDAEAHIAPVASDDRAPARRRPSPNPPKMAWIGPFLAVSLHCAALQAEARPLPVPGYRPAVVHPPRLPGPRPLVLGLHGNFDRPQWFCEAMDRLVGGRAWLLCPRGRPRRDVPAHLDRWTFLGRAAVKRELVRARAELRRRHPLEVLPGPVKPLLAGFSLGAILAARLAVARPADFPRLYLVEGSHHVWTPAAVRRFGRGGGRAVLFGCGRRGCLAQSRRICRALRRQKVTCEAVLAPGLGHGYDGALPRVAKPAFERLWSGFPPTAARTPKPAPSPPAEGASERRGEL